MNKNNSLVFTILLCLSGMMLSCKSIPQKGLVGEYLFNGNANNTSPDLKNNGSVFGASLTSDRKNKQNSAYNFDGVDDYISIADNNELDFDFNEDFSISVWVSVKFPQATPSNGIFDIIRKWRGDVNEGYAYSISYLNENAAFGYHTFFNVRYDGTTCNHGPQQTSTTIDSEAWHHIVMVKQGGAMYQYLDNVMVSKVVDNTSCTTTNDVHVTIGCRGQLVRFFTGKIDDIRFYDRALTATEIKTLFKK